MSLLKRVSTYLYKTEGVTGIKSMFKEYFGVISSVNVDDFLYLLPKNEINLEAKNILDRTLNIDLLNKNSPRAKTRGLID